MSAGSSICAHCARPRPTPVAPRATPAGETRRIRPRAFGEALPKYWTAADPNGARRWGLSFGASLLLAVVVVVFAAYAALNERSGDDAADRALWAHRMHRANETVPTAAATMGPPLSAQLVPLLTQQMANADDGAGAARLQREHRMARAARLAHPRPMASAPRAATALAPLASATPATRPSLTRPAEATTPGVPAPQTAPILAPASTSATTNVTAAPDEAPKNDAAAPATATSTATSGEGDGSRPADVPADKSFSGPVERPAPQPSSSAQPSDAPSPATQPEALRPNAHRSASLETPSASVRHAPGHAVRHGAASHRRRPQRFALAHAPVIVFTLPRFLIAPTMRMPASPRPPSNSFDLSENQRALYRGH
ncbi:hypothetical protein [Trinickia diaoshuihuensis]|uniref:hypothetical protein n=1 Tax=Trinickia diaoshuihuensis TaxID=2292265 RepID=UPI0013C362F3|nr:hypothetical protein [Trinickia diaoshuihuensis]